MIIRWPRTLCIFIVAVVSVTILSGTAGAVKMKVLGGFGGTVVQQKWTPFAVTLENDSDRDLNGTLEIYQDNTANLQPVASCIPPVSLPAGAKKLYHIYAVPNDYGNIQIRLRSGLGIAAQTKVKANLVYYGNYLVVSVGSQDKRLLFLQDQVINYGPHSQRVYMRGGMGSGMGGGMPGMPPMGPQPIISGQPQRGSLNVSTASIEQSYLPAKPAGYDSADMIVLSDFNPSNSDQETLNAIKIRVAKGATLVIPTGAEYAKFQDPGFYGDLLPVTVTGSGSAVRLSEFENQARSGALGLVTCSKAQPNSKCLWTISDSGTMVAAGGRYGNGRVIYIAFDPWALPFRNWGGQQWFWKKLIAENATKLTGRTISPNGGVTQNLGSIIAQNPSIKTVSLNTVWIFLGLYIIVLVPVNYLVLKAKKKLELAWFSVPAIVILFTVGAYGIGYSVKGGSILLSQASIFSTSSDCRIASYDTAAWLFSPARRGYNVELNDSTGIGAAWSTSQYGMPNRKIQFPYASVTDKVSWNDLKMPMWSSQSFEASGGLDLKGSISAKFSGSLASFVLDADKDYTKLLRTMTPSSSLKISLTNNTAYDINNCFVRFLDLMQDIGTVRKGQTVNVELKPTIKNKPYGGMIAPPPMPMQAAQNVGNKQHIRTQLRNNLASTLSTSVNPVLCGEIDAGEKFSLPGSSPSKQSASYIIVDL